ncbi:MAG: zinc ribbon domain-containing protein [Oscillospiraceae bacterium]|nr:zinc ribbon domain-containing protein [Oscillospiraceae bacterium]
MKYCTHCGKEIMDDAIICEGCGCPAIKEEQTSVNNKKKFNKKTLLILIVSIVAAIALIVGAIFLVNHIRVANVINDLSGNTYSYFDSNIYPSLGIYSYTEKEMKFDDDGTMTYSYYYSNIDAGGEYERSYEIKFEDGMIILEAGIDRYEIQYDRYNRIEGIYDIGYDELYD